MERRNQSSGFASMDRRKQREIARKGGMAAHRKGVAHEFTAEEARNAGRKGGQNVSLNRSHMIEIGRLGGQRSAERRRSRMNQVGGEPYGESRPAVPEASSVPVGQESPEVTERDDADTETMSQTNASDSGDIAQPGGWEAADAKHDALAR
jgi:general stress protein YciG